MSEVKALEGADGTVSNLTTKQLLRIRKARYEDILGAFAKIPGIEKLADAKAALEAIASVCEIQYAALFEVYVAGSFRQDSTVAGGVSFKLGTSNIGLGVDASGSLRTVSGQDGYIKATVQCESGLTASKDWLMSIKPVELKELTQGLLDDVDARLKETPEPAATQE